MSDEVRTHTTAELLDAIRYEVSALRSGGAHTYGTCANGCGHRARGGGVCFDCAMRELGRRHGNYKPMVKK